MSETKNKLTVVIMNWARPQNINQFVPQYLNHSRIGEVIIWDCSREHPLTDQCGCTSHNNWWNSPHFDKVRYIRSGHDFGLYPRYTFGALSSESGVLIVDDDIELPEHTIRVLHDQYLKSPKQIHGLIGRRPARDGRYTAETYHGPVEVVLTRALITSPWLCGRAAAWGTRHVRDLPGVPRGNGEDILLSYVAMAESGRLNCAYALPYKNVGSDDAHAISVRVAGHGEHRTKMVNWCRSNILAGQIPTTA